MKELAFWILVVSAIFAVVSCGADSLSNAGFAEAENGAALKVSSYDSVFVLNKFTYEMDAEKSLIRTYSAECRAEGDSFVWNPKKSLAAVSVFTYNASSKSVRFDYRGESGRFSFDGGAFPVGRFLDFSKKTSKGYSIEANGVFNEIVWPADSIEAAAFAGDFLAAGFQNAKGRVNVSVEGIVSGKIFAAISDGNSRCAVSVKPRYASEKEDCASAFAEYKAYAENQKSPKAFSFDDYAVEVGGDTDCLSALLQNLD